MKERRSLIEGLRPSTDVLEIEEEFVFGAKRKPITAVESNVRLPEESNSETSSSALSLKASDQKILPQMVGRTPLTTRCRPEIASALKRVSLQRQLAGIEPNSMQDIMEDALENWLAQNT